MTAPEWLNDTVRALGRQMQLESFALNEEGSAGARFENGREFRLEYHRGALALTVTVEVPATGAAARAVLMAAHPAARRNARIRSGLFAKTSRAFFHARVSERDVSTDMLERVFRELWAAADGIGRVAA